MNYVKLKGRNIYTDANRIRDGLEKDGGTVFLYYGTDTLYDYIHSLRNSGELDVALLCEWKVCYADKTLDVSFLVHEAGQWVFRRHITSMAHLVRELDGKTPCRIIVNSNSVSDLSFIAQQLLFIGYPLESTDILLWREAREMEEADLFWQRADTSLEALSEKLKAIPDSRATPETLRKTREALRTCDELRWQMEFLRMELFRDRKVKLAVAASKKTGKSVMVNCFIGESVAPTDTKLATPNNCIYQKSPDDKYRLRMEGSGEEQSFSDREELRRAMEERFRAAQNDREHGFSLPDMRVSYRADSRFSACAIYDTPGPDAAGSAHSEAAFRAMSECDVVVFAIDYVKYLTNSEMKYLKDMGNAFKSRRTAVPLIVALNKMDARYYDPKRFKSVVEAADFIKIRLGNLAEEYRDCILFPTCALEYLCAAEAEAAGVKELCRPLSADSVRKVKLAHKDVPALAVLHELAENLEYYRGVTQFSYETFKRDSGVPALMDYLLRVSMRTAAQENARPSQSAAAKFAE